ncbi:transposase [Sinorhizobium terangae]|nr:transposase [Sinorhizobium terangae]
MPTQHGMRRAGETAHESLAVVHAADALQAQILNSEPCQRLGKIEGIGPIKATALIAAVGDRTCFKNGRQFAAWLGLVPKQRPSGGLVRLFGISKRGLFAHADDPRRSRRSGSRSSKQDPRSLWLGKLRQRQRVLRNSQFHPNLIATLTFLKC